MKQKGFIDFQPEVIASRTRTQAGLFEETRNSVKLNTYQFSIKQILFYKPFPC